MNQTTRGFRAILLCMAAGAWACASDDDAIVKDKQVAVGQESSIDPAGIYEDNWGTSHRVDEQGWVIGSDSFEFVDFNADGDSAVAKNGLDNPYNPGKFSRFDWATDEDGLLRYCQIVYDANTEEEAAAAPRADESDWDTGCADFSWSILQGPEIAGMYQDDYEGTHEIDGLAWKMGGQAASQFHLLELSNESRFLIAENDPANPYNPGKFSRFDWYQSDSQILYYCQTAYQAESAAAAKVSTPADPTDLTTGCGGFAWSQLTPVVP